MASSFYRGPRKLSFSGGMNMRRNSIRLHLTQLEDRTVPSSPGDIEWLAQIGSSTPPPGDDPARAADSDGNIYVAGDLFNVLPRQASFGAVDAYLRKYDAVGNEMWTRQFGSAGDDRAYGVAVDVSGVYVVGSMSGDAFVRKYDADGNELWN